MNIIPYWGTGNGKLGTGGWGNVPMEYKKRAIARHFRTYPRSDWHCRAIHRTTARDASPPRAPLPHPFRPSHPAIPRTLAPTLPHPLPPRHLLQYVTHIAPTEGTHPHKRPGGVDAIMDGGRNVVTSAFASSRPRRKDSTPCASLRHLRIRRHRPPLSCDTGLLTFPRP